MSTIGGTTLALQSDVNPLHQLTARGQSIWLDNISRRLITSGELQRFIDRDGVTGVTSNPTIFAKALASGSDYNHSLDHIIGRQPDIADAALAECLMIEDIQLAADVLRPVFDRTHGSVRGDEMDVQILDLEDWLSDSCCR